MPRVDPPIKPVYPRVGGGTAHAESRPTYQAGLSPRGRGNPGIVSGAMSHRRSIPAWAGEPGPPPSIRCIPRVYPRVGGGTTTTDPYVRTMCGLSPRGRGNRQHPQLRRDGQRSIPAWAGEPWPQPPWPFLLPVYPRVGGGTGLGSFAKKKRRGLSPRGRGNQHQVVEISREVRSIPDNWAGEPLIRISDSATCSRGLSPSITGGTPISQDDRMPVHRSLPAWPRPRGTPFSARLNWRSAGLSPRGRGNPDFSRHRMPVHRSIPAWAGEPDLLSARLNWRSAGLSPRGRGNPEAIDHLD